MKRLFGSRPFDLFVQRTALGKEIFPDLQIPKKEGYLEKLTAKE
jgi:hypothetical protein